MVAWVRSWQSRYVNVRMVCFGRFGSQGTFSNVWDGALCLGSLGKLVFGMSSFGAAVKVSLSMGRLGIASLVRAVEVS